MAPILFLAVVASLVGAKLMPMLAGGVGFSLFGGLLFGLSAVTLLCRAQGLQPLRILDGVTPCLFLLAALCRMGCFQAGCCSGDVWDGGVSYPAGSGAYAIQLEAHLIGPWAAHSLPVVPLPLIESAILALLFIVGLLLRRRSHRPGTSFMICVLVYAAWRFTADFWRADRHPTFGSWLTLAQGLSIGVILAISFKMIWWRGGRQAVRESALIQPGILRLARLAGIGLAMTVLATCTSGPGGRGQDFSGDGHINRNGQKLIRTSSERSTTYPGKAANKCIMACTRCDLMYYSNTIDVENSECPFCQEGDDKEPAPHDSLPSYYTPGRGLPSECGESCKCLGQLAVGLSQMKVSNAGRMLQRYGEMEGELDVDLFLGRSRIAYAVMTGTFKVVDAPGDGPLVVRGFADNLTVFWRGRSVTGSGEVELRVSLDRQVTLVESTLPADMLGALKAMEPLMSGSVQVDVPVDEAGSLGRAIERELKDLVGDPRCYGTFVVEGEHGRFELPLSKLEAEISRR